MTTGGCGGMEEIIRNQEVKELRCKDIGWVMPSHNEIFKGNCGSNVERRAVNQSLSQCEQEAKG